MSHILEEGGCSPIGTAICADDFLMSALQPDEGVFSQTKDLALQNVRCSAPGFNPLCPPLPERLLDFRHGHRIAHPQVSDWADAIYNFVRTYGLTDSVMVVDELSSGDDVTGTGAPSCFVTFCLPGSTFFFKRSGRLPASLASLLLSNSISFDEYPISHVS